MTKIQQLKHAISLYTFLLIAWGFYRLLFFKVDDNFEELVVKPLVWLIPTYWMVRKEGLGLESLGWTTKNLFRSLYVGIGLGVIFAALGFAANIVKYGTINFAAFNSSPQMLFFTLFVSLATAVSEETVFRGFIFNRVWKVTYNELFSNIVTTVGWMIIHLPVLIITYKLGIQDIGIRLLLTGILGFGSAAIFARTGNIASSVLLHMLWSWPIVLFR